MLDMKAVGEYNVDELKKIAKDEKVDISDVTRKNDIYNKLLKFSTMTDEERKALTVEKKEKMKTVSVITVKEDITCYPDGITSMSFKKDQEMTSDSDMPVPFNVLQLFLVNKKEIATLQNKKVKA